MRRPLTGLALVFAAGIWCGSLADWPVTTLWFVGLCLIAASLLARRWRYGLHILIAAAFVAGVLHYRQARVVTDPRDVIRQLEPRDQNLSLRGVVVSDTGFRDEANDETASERRKFELEVEAVRRAVDWEPATGRVFVFVSEARPVEPLRYGDRVEFSAILRVPPPLRNPGTFDWRAWLERKGIYFIATIRKSDAVTVLEQDRGNPLIAASINMRARFERALRLGLEDEPKLAGVLAGMVIGNRSEIPPETYADFQRTGVFHVFAISGLHVGLVTAVVVVALRLLRIPRRWCGGVAIPLLILYVYATGARPGAVRALVMASSWLIAWMLVRPADSVNNLAAAALALLVFNPMQLFDGGFVLSFMAVLGLVTLTPRFEKMLQRWLQPDPLLPRQYVARWRVWLEPAAVWGTRLLGASLAAWLGLLPLMALYFHLFTPVSVLANVLVIPLLGFIIAVGMLAILSYPLWPGLTLIFNNANFFLLGTMIKGVEALGRMPWGHQFVLAPPAWLIAIYYGIGFLFLTNRLIGLRRRLAAAVLLPACGVVAFLGAGRGQVVELTVLSLNDGAAIFLNLPGERADWLIDGGSDWSAARVVVPYLRAQGVDRLEAAVLTRADKAHAAGLSIVAKEIPIRRAIHNGISSRSKYHAQWLADARKAGIALEKLRAPDTARPQPNVQIRALHPSPGWNASRGEDNALVLAVEFGPTRVLLMSDAGATVEHHLLETFAEDELRSAVLIKGRHGSEISGTAEFLDVVQPQAVVQIAAVRPSTRYPEPSLRERLQRYDAKLYRTDEAGAVTIRLTARGYTIRTCLGQD